MYLFRFQVGDKLPNAIVYEKSPKNQLNIADVFIGRRGVLFAVPGAFTPGCRFVRDIIMVPVLYSSLVSSWALFPVNPWLPSRKSA